MSRMVIYLQKRGKWIDLFCVLFFAFALLAVRFIPHDFLADNWLPLFFSIYFLAGLYYFPNAKRFFALVVISFLLTVTILILYLTGPALGYLLIFILVLLKQAFVPSLIAYFSVVLYKYVSQKLSDSGGLFHKILVFIPLFLVVGWWTAISKTLSEQELLEKEIEKRSEVAKAIAHFHQNHSLKSEKHWSGVAKDIVSSIYDLPEITEFRHGYGGEISLNRIENGISLEYFNVPAGKVCHWFYFINSPSIYGFKNTYVDGVHTQAPSNVVALKAKDEELCYDEKETVTIKYVATFEQLASVRLF